MNYIDLEKQLKTNNLKNIYFFHGNEKYLIDSYLSKVKKIFSQNYGDLENGINYITLNDKTLENLKSEIEMPAFGFEKKLILIKDANFVKNVDEKVLKLLEDVNTDENSLCVIVIVEDEVDKRLSNFKKLKDKVYEVNFEQLSFDKLVSYLALYFKKYNGVVTNGTITFLIEYIGTSLLDLTNEANKLIDYSEGKEITCETIKLLCNQKLENIVFDLTNAISKNEGNTVVLRIYNNLINSKEPLQLILFTLYNHYKKIYKTKIALQDNESVAKVVGLKQNQLFLEKKFVQVANTASLRYWKQLLTYLQDLDYNYKIGKIDLQIGLDCFVTKYCLKQLTK